MKRPYCGIERDERFWRVHGHFIDAAHCLWFIHDHVPGACISTVGEYIPDSRRRNGGPDPRWASVEAPGLYETLGIDGLYETMAQACAPDGAITGEYGALCFNRCDTRDEARAMHIEAVRACLPDDYEDRLMAVGMIG